MAFLLQACSRQIAHGIYRTPILSNFEVQHRLSTSRASHFSYALTAYDAITLHYQYIIIMGICAYEAAIVLNDDKLPIPPKSTSTVHDLSVCGGVYRLTQSAADVDPFLIGVIKAADHGARSRPSPTEHVVMLRLRCLSAAHWGDRQLVFGWRLRVAR
jgi:hypothetical protein